MELTFFLAYCLLNTIMLLVNTLKASFNQQVYNLSNTSIIITLFINILLYPIVQLYIMYRKYKSN